MNKLLYGLSESATISIADKIRKMEAEGIPVIPLHTGDPDFNTPSSIIEEAFQALKNGCTHYSNSRGLPELREELSNNVFNNTKIKFDPNNQILITNGGIHAFYLSLQAVINPGDDVLIPDPTWMSHINLTKFIGALPIRINVSSRNDFFPDIEDLEAACTPKTSAIIINSPSNPTGKVIDKKRVTEIVKWASSRGIYIISDEVYDQILMPGFIHHSFSNYALEYDRIITINSFSKTYAMTGWRIGYVIASAQIINQMLKASQYTVTNVAPFIQFAALQAIRSEIVKKEVKNMVNSYRERIRSVMELYHKSCNPFIKIIEPEGAFYVFADIRELNWGNSIETAKILMERNAVSSVPGSVFGPSGEGYLRFTVAAPPEIVHEGFKRIFSAEREK